MFENTRDWRVFFGIGHVSVNVHVYVSRSQVQKDWQQNNGDRILETRPDKDCYDYKKNGDQLRCLSIIPAHTSPTPPLPPSLPDK